MKTRIAVFSDVHGNLSAMRAMYRDSRNNTLINIGLWATC